MFLTFTVYYLQSTPIMRYRRSSVVKENLKIVFQQNKWKLCKSIKQNKMKTKVLYLLLKNCSEQKTKINNTKLNSKFYRNFVLIN